MCPISEALKAAVSNNRLIAASAKNKYILIIKFRDNENKEYFF